MILKEAFLAITHMATQITGRWMCCQEVFEEAMFEQTAAYRKIASGRALAQLSEPDWEDIVLIDLASMAPILKMFPKLMNKSPALVPTLATALTHHFQLMESSGGRALFITDSRYPQSLRHIAKPPLMLSTLGNVGILSCPAIAVIGSRQASYFGLQQSFLIGKKLSALALTVVSGGAIGCDIAVHQGVLAGSSSSAQACIVFAGGLSRLYPRRHGSIFDQILDRGGLFLSERPWYQGCQKHDFPIRNRIVSGMSEAVIVSQASTGSGSLITAHEALEQGRDVYVLRHTAGDIRAQGSEKLLEDGAIGFADVDELVEHLVQLPQSSEMDWNITDNDDGACQMPQIIDTVEEEQHIN